ncbi:amidohydrolase/deacetylase family metallohydrolase [Alkalicoccobacillus porphyridii]|uniref:Amidohydrolase/deacetylase family metallohydrolase n=1 Tax=Alkalicoccobacillus porphyridii TaxID=2597270 RepID=A0A554A1C1_9BACI|nr:amidohydrolase/deacetylase family metallohydrolase [Alkalicoccobacillus porphyridii]TSB47488.1 amidohydrolase/deacetylase family metallohydrolase [Alkalicoccobacillus porphyridii]
MESNQIVLHNIKKLTGEEVDLVIKEGKIADVTEPGSGEGAVINCTGMFVSSGWIDLHVHAFPEFNPYGDEIDEIGVKQGVTTIVDAGSTGANRMGELSANSRRAKTNVFAFLNISKIGLERVDELSNLEWIDRQAIHDAVRLNEDIVIGLKARISQSVVKENGVEPLLIARELSDETSKPLMVHIGSGPPHIEEVIPLLQTNDVITHYLNGKENNLFDKEGRPLSVLMDAISRGVHLDVGHGTASFSFKVAEAAKANNVHFDTISTDMYKGNRLNGPVYSMANLLTKFLSIGYSLEEVINGVTVNAANWLGKPELGRIRVGEPANLTLFSLKDQEVKLVDSLGDERISKTTINAEGVFVHGEYIKC